MKIKLWTIQNESGWKELQEKGILLAKEKYVYPSFKEGYDWMNIQMEKRIGQRKNKNQYPIWAWFQYFDMNKKKPDLRRSGHLPKGEIRYRIEIEKNRGDVLLSDFVLWHWPLCYKDFIADSEEKAVKVDKELLKFSQSEIENSWKKIFNMNFDLEYYTLPFEEKKIQATFWELKVEDIIKVDRFISK